MELKVGGVPLGEKGSELALKAPGTVKVTVKAAARLPEKPDPDLQKRPYTQKPYWHLERARIGSSNEVPVEVIVNGRPVARRTIPADGATRDLQFDVPIERSSWVALRILPSSHTNPVWVTVGGRPVRASRRSVQWCLEGVDQCWRQKQRFIAAAEQSDAREAYEHARQTYRRLLTECEVD